MKLICKLFVKLSPIMLGYLPVGVSFALIATDTGLSNLEIISMSVFVLGAASQVASIPLIESGNSIAYIFFITLLINFRHAALSTTLSPSLHRFSRKELALFSYGLTDEAFSIHALDVANEKFEKSVAIAVNVGTHIIWVLSTVAGCYLGLWVVENLEFVRLSFALPAMFFSIVVIYIKSQMENAFDGKILRRYVMIVCATAAITWLLLVAGMKSLAFFMPAIVVSASVYFMHVTKQSGWQDGR